jgi:hypothetical protein
MHRDVPKEEDNDFTTAFIGLLATRMKTNFRCVAGSHKNKLPDSIKVIELDKYEYIVCHPHLVHGGCGAEEYNLRLHFYHGLDDRNSTQTEYVDFELHAKERRHATLLIATKKSSKKRMQRKRKFGSLIG